MTHREKIIKQHDELHRKHTSKRNRVAGGVNQQQTQQMANPHTCGAVSATKVFFVNHDVTKFSGPIDYSNLGTFKTWGTDNLTDIGEDFNLSGNPLEILEIPVLKNVGVSGVRGGSLRVIDSLPNVYISTANYPALEAVGNDAHLVDNCAGIYFLQAPVFKSAGSIKIRNNVVLTAVPLPALITVNGDPDLTDGNVDIFNNPSLTSITFPLYLPTDGSDGNYSNNALTAVSVNHILARYVANPSYVSGTINLSGGTNSAPTGQGVTDKATLQSRGVIVITN